MCLASWATELATHSEAIRATITANGAAPPAKENPSGIEKAVAMAGAMNVIDWKRIPPNPTAPRRSSCGCPAAPGPGTGGTPTVAMSNLPGPWWPNYARSGYIPWMAAPAHEPQHALEPSAAEMRSMAQAVSSFLEEFIEGLPDRPASDLEELAAAMAPFREPAPEGGTGFETILEQVGRGAGKGFTTAGPGYLAYIPGGGLWAAAVADFLATGINKYVGVWNAAPALAQIEATAVRWLCDLFGYPAEARGILTSGGSLSNFSAIVAARRSLLPEDFLAGTIYVTDQVHASVTKSAMLAG